MRRSGALLIVLAFAAALAIAGIVGSRTAPNENLYDSRASIELTGPYGAKGLAQTLAAVGYRVQPWRRSLFTIDRSPRLRGDSVTLALLDLSFPPTSVERRDVVRFVTDGGHLVLAETNTVAHCFGTDAARLGRRSRDSAVVATPDGIGALPPIRTVLRPFDIDSAEAERDPETEPCAARHPAAVDTLLATSDGRPIALRQRFASGGTVVILADVGVLTNRALKETDAAAMVVPWFLTAHTRRVIFDEYHHGFGSGGSIFAAAWSWAIARPAGWAMLQLVGAALLALATVAVRFGPALRVVERRRRSSQEHVEAVAVGLERAGASDVAMALLAEGLRRRLGRTRGPRTVGHSDDGWLGALERSARTGPARRAVGRLRAFITHPGGGETVLAAAGAVEDVWDALKRPNNSQPS